jgi:hypothetical protein
MSAMPTAMPRFARGFPSRLIRVAAWVAMAPLALSAALTADPQTTDAWAYQPIRTPIVPTVQAVDWPESSVDRFILARLEAAQLTPSPDAARTTLARRVTFDLIGLPPTPDEIDAFVLDPAPDQQALERVVDRLLASPRFGEHWARHWFDVVRFAESVTLRGFLFKEAWRYRDYVIQAFNEDRPIDQFLREQIAGDLLPAESLAEKQRQLVATTFLMLGNTNLEEQDKKQLEMDVVDEQLDVLGKALLGQTLSCARCHDHKFDPIPTRDYYALAGILKNSLAIQHDNVSAWVERPLPLEPEMEAIHRQHEDAVAALRAEIKIARKSATNEVKALEAQLKNLFAAHPPRPMVMAPREATPVVDLAVHRRGSVHRLGDVVPRGFLQVAAQGDPQPPGPVESGRRELAHWLVHPENPLTRRVFVNRVWLWLMGQGLVSTPDNFGTTGTAPSHPELLDWLASSFGGVAPEPSESATLRPWSLKSLIRELALSRTYRMRSDPSDAAREIDPENRLHSHASRKRLTAEQLRDAMLAISSRLRFDPPRGPTFPATQAADYNFVTSEPWRSVYLPVFRNALPEFFSVFDFPPTSMVTGQRSESTVPTQALFLLNDPFVREQAEATQRRLLGANSNAAPKPAGTDTTGAGSDPILKTYRWTLGRPPSPGEADTLRTYLDVSNDPVTAWTDIVQALFASADFRLLN